MFDFVTQEMYDAIRKENPQNRRQLHESLFIAKQTIEEKQDA